MLSNQADMSKATAMGDDIYNVHKLWFIIRKSLGEYNSKNLPQTEEAKNFFSTRQDSIQYPQHLLKPHRIQEYDPTDPFAHLGKIGYRRNTYQFKGANRDDNNIYGANHMKKMLWLEEMRRRIIAEEIGVTADIDETSIAKDSDIYYLKNDHEPAKSRTPVNNKFKPGRKKI